MSGYAERATTRRRQAGFTLIEVMVAIMLMAIVSLMAWRGLDSIARASAHLEDSTEQGAALLRALNQLSATSPCTAPSGRRPACPAATSRSGPATACRPDSH